MAKEACGGLLFIFIQSGHMMIQNLGWTLGLRSLHIPDVYSFFICFYNFIYFGLPLPLSSSTLIWNFVNGRYLKDKIQLEKRQKYHFFNSFFFRKLADLEKYPPGTFDGRAAFLRVRKWTKKVNLFEKDFIFIPVNHK